MAGVEISRAYVGVAGADIRSVNSRGMVSVARKDREITRQDIQRVLEAAQSAALPSDREILHAVPQEFIVDEQGGIADPLGMLGSRLEVMVHLVTGNIDALKTLLTCVNRAGIEVVEMVFEPLATAEAVLTPDERELGALLIDVGAGTTELRALRRRRDPVQRGGCRSAPATSPTTSRWCCARRSPRPSGSRSSRAAACRAWSPTRRGSSVPTVAGGTLARGAQARAVRDPAAARRGAVQPGARRPRASTASDEALRGGVVLTGGGAQLDGLLELAEQIFDAGVRYGLPRGLGGLVDVISSPTWCDRLGPPALRPRPPRRAQGKRPTKRAGFSVRSVMGSLRGMFSDLL